MRHQYVRQISTCTAFMGLTVFWLLIVACGALADAQVIPGSSSMGQADAKRQRQLLEPMDSSSGLKLGAWRMKGMRTEPVQAQDMVIAGRASLRFNAIAQRAGAKGDIGLPIKPPRQLEQVGVWVHLENDSNVDRVGFQIYDAEGEGLSFTTQARQAGWQFVEADLQRGGFQQSWPQADKNGKVDLPLKSIRVIWFSRKQGPTSLCVDALVGLSKGVSDRVSHVAWSVPDAVEPEDALSASITLNNTSDRTLKAEVEYSLQRNADLKRMSLPDPVHGKDIAVGCTTWTQVDGGEPAADTTLTDVADDTANQLPWSQEGYGQVTQTIDLGHVRNLTHMRLITSDAKRVRRLDVSVSLDGKKYDAVSGLVGVNLQGKWGQQDFPLEHTVPARYVRFRHHAPDEKLRKFSLPRRVSLFDGSTEESGSMPQVGPIITQGKLTVSAEPRHFGTHVLKIDHPLGSGSFVLVTRTRIGEKTHLDAKSVFGLPAHLPAEQLEPRIGMNCSQAFMLPLVRRLGVKWIRFENLKWRMMSSKPGETIFDGSLGPWHMNHDAYFSKAAELDLSTLAYFFQVPEYASSAPQGVKHRGHYPPKDYNAYAEYVFQTVARYGQTVVPRDRLTSADQQSGLGQVLAYQIWNEPNLNNPTWGHWVGSLDQYYALLKQTAEAARQADPNALISNGGFAGIPVSLIDSLRTHTYPDGTHPIDYLDMITAHVYTGDVAPELAKVDTNAKRDGKPAEGAGHLEDLMRLAAWRDQYVPNKPIWITETGYDTAGPRKVSERDQAAFQVRNLLMILGAGIDRVFIYRERGSSPSLYSASGLVRNDLSHKPSYFTTGTLIRMLTGGGPVYRLPTEDPGVWAYAWLRDDRPVVAAWSVVGPMELKLTLGKATVVDAFGGRVKINDASNHVLTDMPVYFEDITNVQLIQKMIAASKTETAAWRHARKRLANARVYLFDFGGTNRVGAFDHGRVRSYTPVTAKQRYNETVGYGFTPSTSAQDIEIKWIEDPVLRDGCKLSSGAFMFKARPGTYRLALNCIPAGAKGKVVIRGAGDDQIELLTTRNQNEVSREIKVGLEPITIVPPAYATLRHVRLVQTD